MPLFNAYIYKPLSTLDTIRLIDLDPATNSEAHLTCQITEHRLSEKHVDYSAVSYTWGEQKFYQTLEIRSSDDDVSYLRITTTVDDILRRLRASNKSRYLWIDAVCLNQRDETEKSSQIPRMGEVFKGANMVDIWLGPENHMIPDLFSFFKALRPLRGLKRLKLHWPMVRQLRTIMLQYFHDHDRALTAISEFFDRPWFSRRWIIQETWLARYAVAYCGSQSIPFYIIQLAALRLPMLILSSYPIEMVASLGTQKVQQSILKLLWHFHRADCLENRDRIAALSSLSRLSDFFDLNYNNLWTEIYRDLACFLYQLNDNNIGFQLLFHLFEFGPVPRPEKIPYPSWIPDWSKHRQRALPYMSHVKNTDTFEDYPGFPDEDAKAVVWFQNQDLFIFWSTLNTGPQGHRVKFAATLDSSNRTDDYRRGQVLHAIRQLFPCIQNKESDLVTFASLLKSVSEFRHLESERERTSRPLGEFEIELTNTLDISTVGLQELLHWLRTFDSIVTDFSVVELEVFGQKIGYGIGPKELQVNDVLIPLWNVEPRSYLSSISSSVITNIETTTSLAVRCVQGCSTSVSDGGSFRPAGEVIGPVVCVMIRPDMGNKGGLVGDSAVDKTKTEELWSCMQLL